MLKERRYNVLIVSSNEKVNNAVTKYLSFCSCDVADIASNVPLARRLVFERNYDIVVISAPVSEDPAIDFAIGLSENEHLGIIYLAREERYDEIYDKIHNYGIITLSKPTPATLFEQSLKVLLANKVKMEKLRSDASTTVSLKQKMEELKLYGEAKVLLMKHEHMNEEEAHRYLEKRAMDTRLSKRKIAEEVIRTYQK